MTQGSRSYGSSDRRGKEGSGRHGSTKSKTSNSSSSSSSSSKPKEKSSSSRSTHPPTKVVVRRLPPSWTSEVFQEQVAPLPEHNYFRFVSADRSLGVNSFSRAYINFTSMPDLHLFHDKFDGYVFVDEKGSEYIAVVEFAPFSKIPKSRNKTLDARENTLETDPDFLKFLENNENATTKSSFTPETLLEEIENKEKSLKGHGQFGPKVVTPLIEYLARKREEKKNAILQEREERRLAEIARRKRVEEERQRKIDRERERKERDRQRQKNKEEAEQKRKEAQIVPQFKLLKNEDRQKAEDKQKKEKTEERTDVYIDDPAIVGVGRCEASSTTSDRNSHGRDVDSGSTSSSSRAYKEDRYARDSKSQDYQKKGSYSRNDNDSRQSDNYTSKRGYERDRYTDDSRLPDKDRDRDRDRDTKYNRDNKDRQRGQRYDREEEDEKNKNRREPEKDRRDTKSGKYKEEEQKDRAVKDRDGKIDSSRRNKNSRYDDYDYDYDERQRNRNRRSVPKDKYDDNDDYYHDDRRVKKEKSKPRELDRKDDKSRAGDTRKDKEDSKQEQSRPAYSDDAKSRGSRNERDDEREKKERSSETREVAKKDSFKSSTRRDYELDEYRDRKRDVDRDHGKRSVVDQRDDNQRYSKERDERGYSRSDGKKYKDDDDTKGGEAKGNPAASDTQRKSAADDKQDSKESLGGDEEKKHADSGDGNRREESKKNKEEERASEPRSTESQAREGRESKQKLRYKDRPERAIYNPAQRAAERQRDRGEKKET